MKKRHLLSLCLVAGLSQHLCAASDVERDQHFWTVKSLIDKELSMAATPELEKFKGAGYPDGGKYGDALRLHYCRTFQLDDPKLGEEIAGLESSISGNFPDSRINDMVSDEIKPTWVLRFVNPLLRDLLPDSPATKLGPEKKERVQKRVDLLIEKTKMALAEMEKKVASNKDQEDKYDNGELDDSESNEVIRKGVELRLAYAETYYFAFLAMREVLYRGDEFGLDKSGVQKFMDEYFGPYEFLEKLGEWDWNYADYQVFLRHRIQVMLSQPVLDGHKYGDYGQLLAGFQDVMDRPLDAYPSRIRVFISQLKVTALADLLYLHVALQKNREKLVEIDKKRELAKPRNRRRGMSKERPNYAQEGIKLWERYKEELELEEKLHKDKDLTNKVAQAYFVAGRLYHMESKVPQALTLVEDIMKVQPRHYYYGNARRWKTFYMKPPEGGAEVSYQDPVKMVNPAQILESVNDIFATARSTENTKQRKKMFLNAAVSLRDTLFSLQDPSNSKLWFELGPTAYFQLSYALYKTDQFEYAALIALEGAQAFAKYYSARRSPFKNADGTYNANIEGLKRLVQNLGPYTAKLRSADTNDQTTALYREALKLLEEYEDIAPDTNPKAVIVAKIQESDYKGAIEALEEFNAEKDISNTDKIWCARIRAYVLYLVWDEAVKSTSIETAKDQEATLDKALATVDDVLMKLKDAKDVAEEATKAKQMKISIEVGKSFRTKDYLAVLLALDEDYWANPPEESAILQKVAGQMAGASYQYHRVLLKEKDPAKAIEMWPHLRRASMAMNMAREKTGASLTNSTKALAETYKNVGKLANWFLELKAAGSKEVPEFNFSQMNKIATQAPLSYGDLMWAVVHGNDENVELVRAVARELQRGNDNARAAILFEQYLAAVNADTKLMAFKDDPKDIVDGAGDIIVASPLGSLRKAWPKVRDLLVDKPGFREGEYRENGGTTVKLSEEKTDYYLAKQEIEKMLAEAKQRKAAMGASFEDVVKTLEDLNDIATRLFTYYQVMDFLVQAYLATGDMENALPYIKTLIAFDPIHPRYRALNVEVVLRSLGGDKPPGEKEILDARGIVSETMTSIRNNPAKRNEFWLAYCQAYELTAALGKPEEIEKINKSLKRHHAADITPIVFDLAADNGEGTFAARTQEGAGLIKRYLKLYDIKGITYPKPYEWEEDDDQLIIRMVKE